MNFLRQLWQVWFLVCCILANGYSATGDFVFLFYWFLREIIITISFSDITGRDGTITASDVELHAFFSQHGIKGSVRIAHHPVENNTESAELPVEERNTTTIEVILESHMDVDPAPYNWAIYELPVEYTQSVSCDKGYLGDKYDCKNI